MSLDETGPTPEGLDVSPPVPPRSWREIAGEVVLVLPNIAKLLARLMKDPRVSIRHKVLIGVVGAYVASPVDVIPDFLVGIGRLDDIILVSLAIDHLMRGAGEAVVLEHWDGSIDALDLVRSVFAWGTDIVPERVRRLLPH